MRRTFTAEEKASVFELWKNGTGFSEIANILGSKPGTICTMLRDTGGIKHIERKRAVAHMTLSEREEIRAGLSAKMSIRFMRDSIRRQTELGNLSDESIRAMLYGHKAKRRDTSAERHEEADPSAAVMLLWQQVLW